MVLFKGRTLEEWAEETPKQLDSLASSLESMTDCRNRLLELAGSVDTVRLMTTQQLFATANDISSFGELFLRLVRDQIGNKYIPRGYEIT